jgi:hypothetical protein
MTSNTTFTELINQLRKAIRHDLDMENNPRDKYITQLDNIEKEHNRLLSEKISQGNKAIFTCHIEYQEKLYRKDGDIERLEDQIQTWIKIGERDHDRAIQREQRIKEQDQMIAGLIRKQILKTIDQEKKASRIYFSIPHIFYKNSENGILNQICKKPYVGINRDYDDEEKFAKLDEYIKNKPDILILRLTDDKTGAFFDRVVEHITKYNDEYYLKWKTKEDDLTQYQKDTNGLKGLMRKEVEADPLSKQIVTLILDRKELFFNQIVHEFTSKSIAERQKIFGKVLRMEQAGLLQADLERVHYGEEAIQKWCKRYKLPASEIAWATQIKNETKQ